MRWVKKEEEKKNIETLTMNGLISFFWLYIQKKSAHYSSAPNREKKNRRRVIGTRRLPVDAVAGVWDPPIPSKWLVPTDEGGISVGVHEVALKHQRLYQYQGQENLVPVIQYIGIQSTVQWIVDMEYILHICIWEREK